LPLVFLFRFHINFASEAKYNEACDVALHLNPRLDEGELVRNCFLNDKWWAEERSIATDFPFAEGAVFQIVFEVTGRAFKVCVSCISQ
jgi:hypothetical protein